ncbi:[NiFe] hydrogenase assembly HybE family chaperone [Vogesella perlucida]|jgi:[NiFe] hydrogenase assembly HybE family chaperone|nr:[NiFe] hydrogenase assembly HybE family chaperone [Vogesella perlucida]
MNARHSSAGWLQHPGAALEQAYRHIQHTRMQGIPILNPAISVESVGFRRYQGWWAGVLITPWFINLMLLPADAPLPDGPAGEEQLVALPEGIMPFLPGSEDSIGPYLMCSLFSPLPQFADQQSARDTASEVLRLLFEIPAPPAATPAGPDLSRRRLFGLGGA